MTLGLDFDSSKVLQLDLAHRDISENHIVLLGRTSTRISMRSKSIYGQVSTQFLFSYQIWSAFLMLLVAETFVSLIDLSE